MYPDDCLWIRELAVEALKHGADDYLAKGRMQIDELETRIARALRLRSLESENQTLKQQLNKKFGLENIIGESESMQRLMDIVRQVAPARATVLIQGESGTGKELLAKAIHQLSPRSVKPMVTVHCAALSPTLLESELFGHEKGAFTGAHERRIGRFEQAEGGTLFLDEIGEVDETTQVKLLRFLGERSFERVGGNKTLSADVRVVAATNKNLKKLVGIGEFREDLYFRLNVVELWAPPLRDRLNDVPLLALNFLSEFAIENTKAITDFTAEALEAMIRYNWPGNVRELRTAVEHAVVLSKSEMIQLTDLPHSVQSRGVIQNEVQLNNPIIEKGVTLEEAEKQLIVRTIKECRGNRTAAAKKVGISRRTLHRKLHRYGLEGI